ncbi:hypothetical protein AKJ65_04705 [candidate division MSBL1 archaeon SCGC-AAA259E19]|uniref:HTH luxR-type domain-containing protein n=1 Tax=candidate division MSBL1 archaeon SCGC-AAA259E19 TaxID=1698264 RepID=A0A133UJR8_9EURY|nr:hypothetical protein AKJ65_04705 [candidate division MSBL1 archaeon SCGC-AAA259E19]
MKRSNSLTQEEIADKVGLDRTTVTKIVNKFSVKEINNAFEEGKSVEEIAKKVGLAGRSSVNKVLKKFSIKEIQQAFKEGKSVEEIAEKFHIDRSTVAKILGNVKERIRSEIHNDGGERIDC